MVMDSLHIICGNCGAYLSDFDKYNAEISIDEADECSPMNIYITCNNCATVHSLTQYMNIKNE